MKFSSILSANCCQVALTVTKSNHGKMSQPGCRDQPLAPPWPAALRFMPRAHPWHCVPLLWALLVTSQLPRVPARRGRRGVFRTELRGERTAFQNQATDLTKGLESSVARSAVLGRRADRIRENHAQGSSECETAGRPAGSDSEPGPSPPASQKTGPRGAPLTTTAWSLETCPCLRPRKRGCWGNDYVSGAGAGRHEGVRGPDVPKAPAEDHGCWDKRRAQRMGKPG